MWGLIFGTVNTKGDVILSQKLETKLRPTRQRKNAKLSADGGGGGFLGRECY